MENDPCTPSSGTTPADARFGLFNYLIERGYAAAAAHRRAAYVAARLPAALSEELLAAGGSEPALRGVLKQLGAVEAGLPRRRLVPLGLSARAFFRHELLGALTMAPLPAAGAPAGATLLADLPPLNRLDQRFVPAAAPLVAAGAEAAAGTGAAAGGLSLGGAAAAAGGALATKEGLETALELRKAPEWPVVKKKTDDSETRDSVDLIVGDDHPPDIISLSAKVECDPASRKLTLVVKVKVRDPDTWGNDTGVDLIEVWAKDLDCGIAAKETEIVQEGVGDKVEGNAGQVLEKIIRVPITCANAFKSEENGQPKFAYALRVRDHNGNSTTLHGICTDGVPEALARCCPPVPAGSSGSGAGGGASATPATGGGSTAPVGSGAMPTGSDAAPIGSGTAAVGSGTAPVGSGTGP